MSRKDHKESARDVCGDSRIVHTVSSVSENYEAGHAQLQPTLATSQGPPGGYHGPVLSDMLSRSSISVGTNILKREALRRGWEKR